jgi:hypothetical protein
LNCENGLLGTDVDFVDNLGYAKLGETLLKVLKKNHEFSNILLEILGLLHKLSNKFFFPQHHRIPIPKQ